MLTQIWIAVLLVLATTLIHGLFTAAALEIVHTPFAKRLAQGPSIVRVILVAGAVMGFFTASLIEVVLWAAAYLKVGAIAEFEAAVYFSMVTFTTLGYGDVTLHEPWRLLGSSQAATGIIMFGWTTALIFSYVQHVTRQEWR